MKDNNVYDHFNRTWVDPYTWTPTEVYVKRHTLRKAIKDILFGLVVSVLMGIMSLAVLILFWR